MPTDTQLQLLTHYALGELPAARLPEIERLLADDGEARAWVERVRRTAAALGAELAAEAVPGLDPARKAMIAARARPPLRLRPWLVIGGSLAAAGLAVAVIASGTAVTTRTPPQPPVITSINAPRALPTAQAKPAVSQPVVIELPPDDVLDVVAATPAISALTVLDQAISEEEPDRLPKGREEAVADVEMGGQASFMAIGAGGGAAGMFGSRGSAGVGAGLPASDPRPTPVHGRSRQPAGDLRYGGGPPQPPVVGAPVPAAGESYAPLREWAFQDPRQNPLSTFGLDVDTASYANLRRFIEQGQRPPAEAVRIEELLNAFRYDSPPREAGADRPFAVGVELADCPWAPAHRLARIAVASVAIGQRPVCNLVFLVDVSGSMDARNKLPLVKTALQLLAQQLRPEDRVAIVTYADGTRIALPSTPGSERAAILAAVERLSAGGSTNGQAGIQLAYRTAQEHAVAGVNRVILCTDGDFNVGISSPQALQTFIEEQRRTGVTLTVLGFGMGNLKDANLQVLANKGNGTYAYIDSEAEARLNLVDRLDRHLVMVAKDAKVQVEFNPARVASWRLIGWEKRALAAREFADDRVDSGDVGADAHVTALYELQMQPGAETGEGLRYQAPPPRADGEVMFVKMRWKRPDRERSELHTLAVADQPRSWSQGSSDFRFTAAVAAFGLTLRGSSERGSASLELAEELARGALGEDIGGERSAFVDLVRRARRLGR